MIIFSLCFLLFINAMSIGLVFPIFAPLFTGDDQFLFAAGTLLSTQSLYYTMILTVPTLFMVFGAPFWGRLSDRTGRLAILLIGLAGLAVSFILSAAGIFYASLFLLFASRALAGFMDALESVAQATIADLSSTRDKARNLGYATFAGTIGFIIGPIVGGVLAEPSLTGRFHYEIPFILSSIITVVNAAILYFFFPQKKSVLVNKHENINYARLFIKGFHLCFDKRIRNFSFLLFVLHLCLALFFQLSTLALVERFNYSPGEIGLFITFLGACFSAGILFVIYVLLGRMKHSIVLKTGIGLIIISILSALYFIYSSLMAWVAVVPMMAGIAMMYNVLLTFVSNAVTSAEQGDAMGSGTSLKALGWLTSGLVVGILYPNIQAIFLIMLGVLSLAMVCAWQVKEATHS